MEQTIDQPKTKKEAKEVKKKPDFTYTTVVEFWSILNLIKNKGLSVESLISLTKLRQCLKNLIDEYNEIHKAIMEKYNIVAEDGRYVFTDHPKKTKITEEITQLLDTEVKVTPVRFLSSKELAKCTEDVSLDVVGFICDKLLKEKE